MSAQELKNKIQKQLQQINDVEVLQQLSRVLESFLELKKR